VKVQGSEAERERGNRDKDKPGGRRREETT